jgi:hypothetical protein
LSEARTHDTRRSAFIGLHPRQKIPFLCVCLSVRGQSYRFAGMSRLMELLY